MAWTEGDLRIFAAGLAIGGRWNRTFGTLPRVEASQPAGVYSSVFDITLSCAVSSATIFYSTDGTTPTTVYHGETINIGDDLTVTAFAVLGSDLSPMSTFRYVIYIPAIDTADTIAVLTLAELPALSVQTPVAISVSDSVAVLAVNDPDTAVTVT
jgi:hypothetical protein